MSLPYVIGTGIGDVTDTAVGLPLQGMADQRQKSTGVESHLYARAFVVRDLETGMGVVIVVADTTPWTARLQRRYRFRNLSASAVHLRFYNCRDQRQWITLPNGKKTLGAQRRRGR